MESKLGLIFALVILVLTGAILATFFTYGFDFSFLNDSYTLHVIRFSLFQALLSTFLSILLALPLSLALYRREFVGKKVLLGVLNLSFVLPALVVVFGLLSIYGNSGFLNHILGQKIFNIYGLSGILLAHVFFNIPLALKVFYHNLSLIHQSQHKLSFSLGLNAYRKFLYLEWHTLKQQIPHIASLIFMLCFSSFAIILSLGGSPKYASLEVAIYQAVKYDFDLALASSLALTQIAICLLVLFFMQRFSKQSANKSFKEKNQNIFLDNFFLKFFDIFLLFLAVLFFMPPLFGVVFSGLNDTLLSSLKSLHLLKALFNSIVIAFASSTMALIVSFFISYKSSEYKLKNKKNKSYLLELTGSMVLIIPSIVISTGLFILLNGHIDVFRNGIYFVILTNALLALPFSLRVLSHGIFTLRQEYENLCISLNLKGISRFKIVELRALRATFFSAFGVGFVLSFGDLGAISLFGSSEFKTLPLLLYEQLGSYQMQEASVSAMVLLLLSFSSFIILERLGRIEVA